MAFERTQSFEDIFHTHKVTIVKVMNGWVGAGMAQFRVDLLCRR